MFEDVIRSVYTGDSWDECVSCTKHANRWITALEWSTLEIFVDLVDGPQYYRFPIWWLGLCTQDYDRLMSGGLASWLADTEWVILDPDATFPKRSDFHD